MKIIKFTNPTNQQNAIATIAITDQVEWNKILDQARLHLGKALKVAGFRKGKVPLDILAKKLDSNAILKKAVEFGMNAAYKFVLKVHKKDLSRCRNTNTKVEKLSFSELQITFEWEPLPKIKLTDYQNLKLTFPQPKVTNSDVQERIQQLKVQHAEYITKHTSKLVKGDFVTIDYDTIHKAKPIKSAKINDYRLELGKPNHFLAEFNTALMKLQINKPTPINCTYPAKYYNPELAGKTVVHNLTIKKLETQILPKIKKLIELLKLKLTEQQFQENVKQKIINQQNDSLKPQVLKQLKANIVKNSQIDIPTSYLMTECKSMKENFIARLKEQKKQTLKDYLVAKKQTESAFEAELKSVVEHNIGELLMIYEIAKIEKIEITDQELEQYYEMLAKYYKMELQKLKSQYPSVILSNHLLRGKVEDLLLTKNWKPKIVKT